MAQRTNRESKGARARLFFNPGNRPKTEMDPDIVTDRCRVVPRSVSRLDKPQTKV